MGFLEQVRSSTSNAIDRVWSSQSDTPVPFVSYAESRSEIVFARADSGEVTVSVRGPESVPSLAQVMPGLECVGIVFRHGTYLPSLLPRTLSNRRDAELRTVDADHFLWEGTTWEIPTFENAETFMERLLRRDLLVHDSAVDSILRDEAAPLAVRTYQYRFLKSTGLTYAAIRQIRRARQAVALLAEGRDVQTVLHQLGYYDQSHLTRSVKRFTGLTPLQLSRARWRGTLLTTGAF